MSSLYFRSLKTKKSSSNIPNTDSTSHNNAKKKPIHSEVSKVRQNDSLQVKERKKKIGEALNDISHQKKRVKQDVSPPASPPIGCKPRNSPNITRKNKDEDVRRSPKRQQPESLRYHISPSASKERDLNDPRRNLSKLNRNNAKPPSSISRQNPKSKNQDVIKPSPKINSHHKKANYGNQILNDEKINYIESNPPAIRESHDQPKDHIIIPHDHIIIPHDQNKSPSQPKTQNQVDEIISLIDVDKNQNSNSNLLIIDESKRNEINNLLSGMENNFNHISQILESDTFNNIQIPENLLAGHQPNNP